MLAVPSFAAGYPPGVLVAVYVVVALAAVLLVWALWRAATDRAVVARQLVFGGVVVLAILVQAVVGLVQLLGGHEPEDALLFWGYVLTCILVLPVAGAWAFADRTRWSSVVLAVAVFSIMVMELRVWQVWVP